MVWSATERNVETEEVRRDTTKQGKSAVLDKGFVVALATV